MTKWAGVIGTPIGHSLSPALHRAAYALAGLDWEYFRFEVDDLTLGDFMENLGADCVGLSVTMPCKRAIFNQVDSVEPLAKTVGAINTVVVSAGIKAGFNTDVHGIVQSVSDSLEPEFSTLEQIREYNSKTGKRAVILGTGATASSALAAVASLGYSKISVVGRNFVGQDNVLQSSTRLGVQFDPLLWKQPEMVNRACQKADLLISTVPGNATTELSAHLLPKNRQILLDVTYSKGATPLDVAYRQAGAVVVSPLAMLVHQGIAQVKLMSGKEVPYAPVYEAVEQSSRHLR